MISHAEDKKMLYGLVLAGGESRRMGQDKAGLLYQGRPQLDRAMDLLTPLTQRAFISVKQKISEGVRAAYLQLVDLHNVSDVGRVTGPSAGLLAAYAAFPKISWLVLACDLPLLNKEVLETLKHEWQKQDESWEAFSYQSGFDGLAEPLCAIWTPAMLARLKILVAEGKTCPRYALKQGKTMLLPPVTTGALDNINTQEERRDALGRLSH